MQYLFVNLNVLLVPETFLEPSFAAAKATGNVLEDAFDR